MRHRNFSCNLSILFFIFIAPPVVAEINILENFESSEGFLDPSGFFSVIMPTTFKCELAPRKLMCEGGFENSVHFSIVMVDVPKTASIGLIGLNQLEEYEKKPHFRVLSNQKTRVDQNDAIVQIFRYDEFGNIDYPLILQFLDVLKKGKLLKAKFKCRFNTCGTYMKSLEGIYSSLKLAPLDKNGFVIKGALKSPNVGPKSVADQLKAAIKALSLGF